jgi:hypothetical protein
MKKYLIPLIVLVAAVILSYNYNLISFLLLAIAAISLAVLLVAGIVKAFRKSLSPRWLRVPLIITGI